jgi:hypothetical protein
LFKGSPKITAKKVVVPTSRPVTPIQANISTQKPPQDCSCAQRQMNRARMTRLKRQLPSQKLNQ